MTSSSPPAHLFGPVLVAGLLGGLLGGAASFTAGRLIKPAPSDWSATAKADAGAEAREVANKFMDLLKTGKYEEFLKQVEGSHTFMTKERFEKFKTDFDNDRILADRFLGRPRNEYELVHEEVKSTDLVALSFLEKFDQGVIYWHLILYRGKDRWKIVSLLWNHDAPQMFMH